MADEPAQEPAKEGDAADDSEEDEDSMWDFLSGDEEEEDDDEMDFNPDQPKALIDPEEEKKRKENANKVKKKKKKKKKFLNWLQWWAIGVGILIAISFMDTDPIIGQMLFVVSFVVLFVKFMNSAIDIK